MASIVPVPAADDHGWVGKTQQEQIKYLFEKLIEVRNAFAALRSSLTKVLYAAPGKPREGMFAFADGTTWNPGSGRGLYQYVSGAWAKL